jgi:hypothetical protein
MRVTVVVGEREREVVPSGMLWWARERAAASLAADEQGLLDELTRLCREILLVEERAVADDLAAY